MTAMREGLPPVPRRMQALSIEARGYPVPWFVEWIDGKPDFRVIDSKKWLKAVKYGNCWLCGEYLGRWRTFVLGPMCVVNRTTSEPPCHLDCATFAVLACPFMILPRAKRRETNMPDNYQEAPGYHLDRNPGATALWTTESFTPFPTPEGGVLLQVGEPSQVAWYAEGRAATRAEIEASIDSGMPFLEKLAREQSSGAVKELQASARRAQRYLPAVLT